MKRFGCDLTDVDRLDNRDAAYINRQAVCGNETESPGGAVVFCSHRPCHTGIHAAWDLTAERIRGVWDDSDSYFDREGDDGNYEGDGYGAKYGDD